jgi:hypothetical protein
VSQLDCADPVVKTKVLQVSAANIERGLADARLHIDGKRRHRRGVAAAIRRSIPVRTFADWRDPAPGFFEIDMVSGWTECVANRLRDQMLPMNNAILAVWALEDGRWKFVAYQPTPIPAVVPV